MNEPFMSERYILDKDWNPVPEPDLLKWAEWIEKASRRVGDARLLDSRVSTVFLGMDHSFGRSEPVLWETLVFGGPMNMEMDRCSGTPVHALEMHSLMVARVMKAETSWRWMLKKPWLILKGWALGRASFVRARSSAGTAATLPANNPGPESSPASPGKIGID